MSTRHGVMRAEPNFYILRTPSLSIDRLMRLLTEDAIVQSIHDPFIGEAVRVASPSLFNQLQADPQILGDKLRQAVLKYILRMGSRCTPFGLFAGYSTGKIKTKTNFDLTQRHLVCRRWLDMIVLWELSHHLNAQPALRSHLRFWPNSSLYQVGKQWRYTERMPEEVTDSGYFLSQIDATAPLRLLLRRARQGATIVELKQVLLQQAYPESEAQTLIDDLINDQVLVSELTPNVTGTDCLTAFIDILQRIPDYGAQWEALKQVRSRLQQQHNLVMHDAEIRTILKQQIGLSLPTNILVQTDASFEGGMNELSQPVLAALRTNIDKLQGLSHIAGSSLAMENFRHRFYTRYEEREIPLSIALDSEMGVGYGTDSVTGDCPLIRDILPSAQASHSIEGNQQTHQWLHHLYTTWLSEGNETIQLTETDLASLPRGEVQLPSSYYALGYFLAASPQAIDQGDYQFVLKALGGSSAFDLMGRFCRDDAQLTEQVRTSLAQLQREDEGRIYAEIAHLPSARAGNVVQRPHLRAYEIPYLTSTTLPSHQQITLDDLWISVPNGERVVLRSRRLGKEVVPCLTTAHNYQTGLPIYRFLGDLQQPATPLSVRWDWGGLNHYRHLPRISYQQIVLAEARWRLNITDLTTTLSDELTIQHWRQTWHIPRLVAAVQGDQELFLDLDIIACQQLLIVTLRRLKTLCLIEWLRTPDKCCVTGPDGKLTHEVILPFVNSKWQSISLSTPPISTTITRTFVPGSEWLYLKVYSGVQVTQLVLEKLGKLSRKLIQRGQITHWFFVRYQDPEPHLRVRFHLSAVESNSSVLAAYQQVLKPLIDSQEIYRIQLDTYQREIERYGEHRIAVTEWLFWADSETIYQLGRSQPIEGEQLANALVGLDTYLTDFKYSLADKLAFSQHRFDSLFNEQGAVADTQKLLAQKYRSNETLVKRVLTREGLSAPESDTHRLFKARSRRNQPFLELMKVEKDIPFSYVASLLHLSINRCFPEHQRTYELLVYHHLARGYQSLLARSCGLSSS